MKSLEVLYNGKKWGNWKFDYTLNFQLLINNKYPKPNEDNANLRTIETQSIDMNRYMFETKVMYANKYLNETQNTFANYIHYGIQG